MLIFRRIIPEFCKRLRRFGFSAYGRISRTAFRVAFAVQSARSKNSDRLHMCHGIDEAGVGFAADRQDMVQQFARGAPDLVVLNLRLDTA
jgi:hypothetical protein